MQVDSQSILQSAFFGPRIGHMQTQEGGENWIVLTSCEVDR